MDLKFDGDEYVGDASMFFLALTNSVGGFEQIVPDASLNDGMFTMIIVKTSNLAEILHLLTLVLNGGRHINDPRIIYRKVRKVDVKSLDDSRIMINLDGEYGGDAPMNFTNLKQHIETYANLDDIPDAAVETEDPELLEAERKFLAGVHELPEDQSSTQSK